MSKQIYIECGKAVNTHGCYGGIKLESWCNSPEELAELKTLYIQQDAGYEPYRVLKASVFKQFVLVTLDGVRDMDAALALKGKTVYALREDFALEEGEYFIADLIGLKVLDAHTKKEYGVLAETINRGASDIYVVKTPAGERMIPVVDEFVARVDLEEGIFVTPIEGMLD